MIVAYISHHNRFNYEYAWLSRLKVDTLKILDTDLSSYPSDVANNIELCKVDYVENPISKGRLHSSASMVHYKNFEKYLENVDVVVVLEIFSSLSKQFVDYCRSNNIKVVVLVYELIASHPLYYMPTHIINRWSVVKKADHFICVSSEARNSIRKLGVDNSRSSVIYPGIDMNLFGSHKVSALPNNLSVIFVGGLYYHKGIDIFLQAAERLTTLYPLVEFTVVGDGNDKHVVEETHQRFPNIHYLGRIPNNELSPILKRHQIYVLPCRDVYKFGLKIVAEQFGFSLVEAMACGLAVITTDAGAIAEIVTNNNSICKQNDVDSVIDALRNLIDNRTRLQDIRKRNAELAKERYDIQKQADKLLMRLEEIIIQ